MSASVAFVGFSDPLDDIKKTLAIAVLLPSQHVISGGRSQLRARDLGAELLARAVKAALQRLHADLQALGGLGSR
jgi:hypothetical protein